MGLGGILSNQQKVVQILSGTSVVAQFDASIREHHSRESPATEFQIEDGTTVSDHVIIRPFKLQMTVYVVDAPLSALTSLLTSGVASVINNPALLGAAAPALALAPALFPQNDGSSTDFLGNVNQRRSTEVYNRLLSMQSSRMPYSIFTSLKLYKNMWFKNIGVPRTANTGRALAIDIEFSQLLVVSSKKINIAVLASPDSAAPQVSTGSAQGDPYFNAGNQQGGGTGATPQFPNFPSF